MVEGCRDPVLIELFGERFRGLPCETVDNAGPGPVLGQNAEELCPFVLCVPDFEIQIRPVEPCRERCGLFEVQIRNDLLPHGRCRGSRERTDRRTMFHAVCEIPDLSIGGAKIPAPVRDTVGFVDCEERDVCIFRKGKELARHKPLGRDIEEAYGAPTAGSLPIKDFLTERAAFG